MSTVKNIDFMFEIAFNKKLPFFYNQLINNNTELLNFTQQKLSPKSNTIYNIFDVPSHLKVTKKNLNLSSTSIKTIIQHKGYCIELNNIDSIESYLKNQFGRSSRQALRSGKKRLETCFDISYKIYFGEINKDKYDVLFKEFFKMLKLRADEKGIDNRNLKSWDLYTKTVYNMILKKEASLFVIYDGNNPINISLNMHLKDTVFLFITTYNIDYSKFRIGHTNWMWLIDWFLKNNIKLIDFSKGNTAYKKRWSNIEYDFEYHLFYNKSDYKSLFKVNILEQKLKLKQILRNLNFNSFYYSTINKIKGVKKYKHQKNHKFTPLNNLPEKKILKELFIQIDNQYSFLRPIIYPYLYLSSTNIKDLQIFTSTQNSNLFFIKNKDEILKLILDKQL